MPLALLDPAVLFFVLGVLAGALRSNLEVPKPVVHWLSLYLLMAVGLKGGFTLAQTGLPGSAALALAAATAMALGTPLLAFMLFRLAADRVHAAALAATYGSVSVVTFVAAVQHLDGLGVRYSGTMSVALVLMEIPAIVIGIALARAGGGSAARIPLRQLLSDSLRDGAPMLLVGSLLIGWLTGARGQAMMEPFSGALFKGMLALFLLQMGLDVANRFAEVRRASPLLIVLALVVPLAHAGIALLLGRALVLAPGDVALLAVLSASASYIVAPAVLRHAVPEASPALYLGLALGVTFPFNLILGIGLYSTAALRIAG